VCVCVSVCVCECASVCMTLCSWGGGVDYVILIQEPLPSIDVLFTLISWLLTVHYKSHDIVPNFQCLFPLCYNTAVSILSIEYLISGGNFQEFIKTFESLAQNPALWTSCKFMIALPFTYHCINGLRHLVRR
jgi:hypothetical protein